MLIRINCRCRHRVLPLERLQSIRGKPLIYSSKKQRDSIYMVGTKGFGVGERRVVLVRVKGDDKSRSPQYTTVYK